METLSSFKESGFVSKKEWVFPNHYVFYMKFLVPFVLAGVFYDIYQNSINKLLIVVIIYYAYLIADYITAFIHCYYVDESYTIADYPVEDGYAVVDTAYGYASHHHFFPSGWKDIPDITILASAVFAFILPLISIHFIRDKAIKMTLYFIVLFLIITPLVHKYAHEKLHERPTPFIIDTLSSYGILLPPKKHQTHHVENNYNWGLLSGKSDPILNFFVRKICNDYKKCPMEKTIRHAKENSVNNIVKIKFVGDIEGKLVCKINGNLIVKIDSL